MVINAEKQSVLISQALTRLIGAIFVLEAVTAVELREELGHRLFAHGTDFSPRYSVTPSTVTDGYPSWTGGEIKPRSRRSRTSRK